MAIRYRDEAARTSPLLEYAARAPRLRLNCTTINSAFLSECLVRAVELRLRHLAPGDLASEIDQAEIAGYVLVRPIYAGLSGFEKSEPAMDSYFPDLIKGIDVAAEARRLRGVTFSDAAAVDEGIHASGSAPVTASKSAGPEEEDLAEGQRPDFRTERRGGAASFERVLAAHPNDLRATYGLAVASALLGKPDRARELFSKVIAAASQNSTAEGSAQTGSHKSSVVAHLSRENVRYRGPARPRGRRVSGSAGCGWGAGVGTCCRATWGRNGLSGAIA